MQKEGKMWSGRQGGNLLGGPEAFSAKPFHTVAHSGLHCIWQTCIEGQVQHWVLGIPE